MANLVSKATQEAFGIGFFTESIEGIASKLYWEDLLWDILSLLQEHLEAWRHLLFKNL